MKEFLKSVVDYYLPLVKSPDGNFNSLGLSEYLFVFPNRRSGLFFNHYLLERVDVPVFAPEMTTISELFSLISEEKDIRVLDRIELLFNLFEVYKEMSKSEESFDSFLFWGEMLLSDFNDADKYLVDAHLLFTNVTDLKEIEEKFDALDEEQIKIIKSFWTNFNPKSEGKSKDVFKQTWKILFELYSAFKERLVQKNEAYDGMLQRSIIEDLHKKQSETSFEKEQERLTKIFGKKVVFVGLTALSKVDIELMKHLQKYQLAEFWWDYVDERLNESDSHASFFKASTINQFPNVVEPNALKDGLIDYKDKHFEVIEVPSGVGQAIQAADILKQWQLTEKDAFKTAVVLPDEKMLLPLLYSMPKEYEPFNVTMGYSLKATTIASFVDNLAQLQINLKQEKTGYTFYYKNVLPLLATGFVMKMSDGKAEALNKEIIQKNLFRISPQNFENDNLLKTIFTPCENGKDCMDYLKKILDILAQRAEQELEEKQKLEEEYSQSLLGEIFAEEREQGVFSEIEREFLYTYIQLVDTLGEKIQKYDIEIGTAMFFSLLRKLSNSESVAFSGEPLSGLQVMGVLETRSLDFENLIILSANEGVFPAKPVANSFIPMNLRNAFGMPTQIHKDAVFAYHFYRLISRARNVIMIYDSRSEGMQSGEPSRYIKQLEYLYGVNIAFKSVQFNIRVEENGEISVPKSKRVLEKLNECRVEVGKRNLSASVLKYYIHCPLRFYFEFVEGLREDDEIEENIDDKTFGSILHGAMEDIYASAVGKKVKPEHIDNFLKDTNSLRRIIENRFYEEMKVSEIRGYLQLVEDMILAYVKSILEHDKQLGEFFYVASEEKQDYPYKVDCEEGKPALEVNITTIFDRLDIVEGGIERIVDYKTGNPKLNSKSKLEVPEISMIFNEKTACSTEAFQVMLYSLLYNKEKVSPHLYFVRDFKHNPERDTALVYLPDKTAIINFDNYRDEFKKSFDRLLLDIFDENKKFEQTKDKNNCKICNFKNICKRN